MYKPLGHPYTYLILFIHSALDPLLCDLHGTLLTCIRFGCVLKLNGVMILVHNHLAFEVAFHNWRKGIIFQEYKGTLSCANCYGKAK
jgi:hypothetical protein